MDHPQLQSLTATGPGDVYRAILLSASGEEVIWQATVVDAKEGPEVIALEPGPNGPDPWRGDAESVRSIVAAVLAFHRARHYGR